MANKKQPAKKAPKPWDASIRTVRDYSMKTVSEPSIKIGTSSLIHWAEGEAVTPYTAVLQQHMVRLKIMRSQASQMIDRMRACAQPNEQFRAQRLVPEDVGESSDREKLIQVLKESVQACFGDREDMISFTNQVIAMEQEVEKAHEIFLRQVMLYCVTPLRKFADEDYPAIMKEYDLLEKRRQSYDEFRRRYGKSPSLPPGISSGQSPSVDPKVSAAKNVLFEQANTLEKLFDQTPKTQMIFAKAVATFVLGEMAYRDKMHKLTNAIKPPEHPSRWVPPVSKKGN